MDGDRRLKPFAALALQCHVDHHDGVLLHDADQQQHADHGDDAELDTRELQREQRTDTGRRQGRQDGDRMDVAFVEDAQHDIDRRQRGENEDQLVAQRLLESTRRALERTVQGRWHADLAHRVVDVGHCIAQRLARRQVERNGARHEHALVIDRQRRRVELIGRERRQRHQLLRRGADGLTGRGRASAADGNLVGPLVGDGLAGRGRRRGGGVARRVRGSRGRGSGGRRGNAAARLGAAHRSAGRADIDVLQPFGVLPPLRRHLHDDVILVERVVDGRNLALPERVVERRRDGAGRDTEPARGVAIDGDVHLQSALLLIGIDVGDDRRIVAQRLHDLRRPGIEVGQRIGPQRVLVERIALAAADPDVLDWCHEERRARHLRELGAQAGDHLIGRCVALLERLQGREQKARVGLEAAGEARHALDRRIGAHDLHELPKLPPHRLEGDALIGADPADDASGVLLREEAFGDRRIEMDVEQHRDQEDQDRDQRMAQHQAQAAAIALLQQIERPLAQPEEQTGLALAAAVAMPAQHIGAHHRCRGQRDDHGDEDGDRERHREFAEQTADDAAHQQDRDEHRDQRQAHRDDGEADLPGALERRRDP